MREEFVRTCENRPPSLTGVDIKMGRMRFTNVSEVLWQGHDRWARQFDMRTGLGAILPRARSSCPSSDSGAPLSSAGSSDAPTANA